MSDWVLAAWFLQNEDMDDNGENSQDEVQLVEPDKEFLTSGDLQAMGFTEAAIEKFLTPVDDGKISGAYVSESGNFRSPTRFYSQTDVQRALNNPVVQNFLLKSKERRAGQDAKKGTLIQRVTDATVTVRAMPFEEAQAEAVEQYNGFNAYDISAGRKDALVLPTNDPRMVARINHQTLQHIRHNLTNYDELWSPTRNQPGADEAQKIVAYKTAKTIRQHYPQLGRYIDEWVNNRKAW